jgi:hypothetical protein
VVDAEKEELRKQVDEMTISVRNVMHFKYFMKDYIRRDEATGET